jgi:DNA-binding SARP family transcriptional activator
MATLSVCLFGKLCVRLNGQELAGFDARKIQELFCYLLLHRDHPHPREVLASLLWGNHPTEQSKKYLRQAIWQLQTALEGQSGRLLRVDPEWVDLDSKADLWLDVAVLERAFAAVQNLQGRDLDAETAQNLERAVRLYQGDLLEGWYQDWCLYERERLQNMYLAMLDKLMGYCEANREYETGIVYGTRILFFDRAREHTHRQLMRLHYLAGNRTSALRQYERCLTALDEELGVKPAKLTLSLYEQVRADQVQDMPLLSRDRAAVGQAPAVPLPEVLGWFRQLRDLLADIQHVVQQGIQAAESTFKDRR